MMAQSGQAHQSKDQSWSNNPATVYALNWFTDFVSSCTPLIRAWSSEPVLGKTVLYVICTVLYYLCRPAPLQVRGRYSK
jgi:hypothetical protein